MNKKAVIDLVLEEFNDSVIRYGVRNNTDYTALEILLNIIYETIIRKIHLYIMKMILIVIVVYFIFYLVI